MLVVAVVEDVDTVCVRVTQIFTFEIPDSQEIPCVESCSSKILTSHKENS